MPLPTRTPEAGEGREGHGWSASQRIAGVRGRHKKTSLLRPCWQIPSVLCVRTCRILQNGAKLVRENDGKLVSVGMGMHGLRYAELRTGIWHVIGFWPLRGMNHKFRATA